MAQLTIRQEYILLAKPEDRSSVAFLWLPGVDYVDISTDGDLPVRYSVLEAAELFYSLFDQGYR